MKKSPTKSKSKGKAGSKPWPNDTHIWTAHSVESPAHVAYLHHFPQIQAHVQVGLGEYVQKKVAAELYHEHTRIIVLNKKKLNFK